MAEQGSQEWFASRRGMIGASMVNRIMSGTTKGLETLRQEIRDWRKTGQAPPDFNGTSTDWGTNHEPQARANAVMASGIEFETCGMIVHPELFFVGASPDGIAPERRIGLELKCPHNPDQHLRYLERRNIPKTYVWQMHCGMWCTGYDRWLFASFDPRRLARGEKDFIIMHWFERSERKCTMMEERLTWFWSTI